MYAQAQKVCAFSTLDPFCLLFLQIRGKVLKQLVTVTFTTEKWSPNAQITHAEQ